MLRRITLYIISALAMVLIPFFAGLSLMLGLFLNDGYHVSIIKGLNLTETIIRLKNYQLESDVRREIEKKTGISQFKPEYDRIKGEYESRLLAYNQLNKTAEYEKLENQIDELDDLDWDDAPDRYKTEEDWKAYKKLKMTNLKLSRNGIEEYRDKNEEAIEKAEDEMKAARDSFEEAEDTLKDKEEEARDIIEDRSSEFMNEIVHDMAIISPELSKDINTLFIDTEIRRIIRVYLDFFTSYFTQKKYGNVYETAIDVESGIVGSTKKVVLPSFELSFNVKTEENGTTSSKNIFSELFVEKIKATPGLKSPWILEKIFSMADSWLVETVAGRVLKGTGASYSGGVFRAGNLILSGRNAILAEYAMMAMTAGRYMIIVAPVLALLLLLLVILTAQGKAARLKWAGLVIELPSALIAAACIVGIIASLMPGLFVTIPLSDPAVKVFAEKAILSTGMHIFVPLTLLFFILAIAGGIIRSRAKKVQQ